MGTFNEEQRKTFPQLGFKFLYILLFLLIDIKNKEANHDISFYPTKNAAVFSTSYLPQKPRYFRYLLSVLPTSLKVCWS